MRYLPWIPAVALLSVLLVDRRKVQAFTTTNTRPFRGATTRAITRRTTALNAAGRDGRPSISSREPHRLSNGWHFAGIKDGAPGSKQSRPSFSQLNLVDELIPEGGSSPCVIRVLGVGGGGCNAVDRMIDFRVPGVNYWCINTDAQALGRSRAMGTETLNIGTSVTKGLGAGGDPEKGRQAAEESRDEIAAIVEGSDLVFVTSGMGGGTGSGAAPVVAEVAKSTGALTVAVVTKPFNFEGRRRMRQATDAIARLRQEVDTIIVVANNRLLEIIPDNTPVTNAFAIADDILRQGVTGIAELIVLPGLVNVDFADVRSIMSNAGTALMGIGTAEGGRHGAQQAAINAISSPLLEEPVKDAKGVVFNVVGPEGLTLKEIEEASEVIYGSIDSDANVIFGARTDPNMENQIALTVLAAGFGGDFDAPPPDLSSTMRAQPTSGIPDFLGGGR